MNVKSSRLLVLTIGVAIVAASCGTADFPTDGAAVSSSSAVSGPTSTVKVSNGDTPELTAACGSVRFDPDSIDLGGFDPFTGEIGSLVGEQAREEYEASLEWWESMNWSVVETTEVSLLLFGQVRQPRGEEPPFGHAQFELGDEGWRATGWGQCRIEIGAVGFGVATFTLDPDNPPSSDSAALHLLATERACASGQAPVDRQVLPVVVESGGAVDITVLVEGPVGGQDCQGNPAFSLMVQLSVPLSDRVISDGAFYPSEERPWPIPQDAARLALKTAGDPPAPGTANAVAWTGTSSGALLFGASEWTSEPTWFQSFEGEPPIMISGFVTECDPTAGCEEECEGGDCDALPSLGDECTMAYTPIPGQETTMTVHFTGTSCIIEVVTDGPLPLWPPTEPGEAALCAYQYPEDLGGMPVAFDGTIVSIRRGDHLVEAAGTPVDLELRIHRVFRGGLGDTVTMHTWDFSAPGAVETWDPSGLRILAAAGESLDMMFCGFTRPHSSSEAELWEAEFSG